MKRALLVLALIATPAAAQQGGDAFNLDCTGTVQVVGALNAGNNQLKETYRVDLERGEWCLSECRARFPIAEVQPASLTLRDEEDNDSSSLVSIDRETGEFEALSITSKDRPQRRREISVTGKCERAPFSGFPSFTTKF